MIIDLYWQVQVLNPSRQWQPIALSNGRQFTSDEDQARSDWVAARQQHGADVVRLVKVTFEAVEE